MTQKINTCQIWGSDHPVEGWHNPVDHTFHIDSSPRTGGGYLIPDLVETWAVEDMSPEEKARLTTWLIDQRSQGEERPLITKGTIEYVKAKSPLPVHERADRLLRLLADQTTLLGTTFDIRKDLGAVYAWSESIRREEIGYLVDYLVKMEWVDSIPRVTTVRCGDYQIPALLRVTVGGRGRISELKANVDSSQVFVAMWFSEEMTACFEKGIRPAVEAAGFRAMRIDQKEHINKIDDEIIAEIRRSRFLVADFTQGSDGARGGVYYEAGFAQGLGLPVIFTCREDSVKTLHFDTNHYNHIVWNTPEELCANLKNRILAVIGEGPEAHKNS